MWSARSVHPEIAKAVLQAGVTGAWEWTRLWPRQSYYWLCQSAGRRFTPNHLVIAQFTDAIERGLTIEVTKDSLVREFWANAPNGWGGDDEASRASRAAVYSEWITDVRWGFWEKADRDPSRVPEFVENAWQKLKAISPPTQWIPNDYDDPMLVVAFCGGAGGSSVKILCDCPS